MKQWNDSTRAAIRRRMLAPRPQNAARRIDPSERLFARIRLRLALQYTAVLAALLLLAGLLLYFGMQHQLLGPISSQLQFEAQQETLEWQQSGTPPGQCLPGSGQDTHELLPYLVACFTPQGSLISTNLAPGVTGFAASDRAQAAIANPSQSLTDLVSVEGPNGSGTVERYTVAVLDPTEHQVLGAVQIGLDVTQYIDALHTLLALLFIVGAITLLCSLAGGAILASRALAPARLAFARQQAFIADASHELRTPITLLRTNAEVLLRGRDRLDPEDAPLLDDIVIETEHMGAIAENMLTLARLDSGGYHLEQEVVDVSAVAQGVARRVRSLVEERQIQLTVEPEPNTLVLGDAARLGEAALILVDNAIKYNRAGGAVTIRTYRDAGLAVFEVRDTGIGIPPEHLQRLGERFYRVDKARSRQMGGAGLGISIARGIAAAHHGTLTLTSVPGQGTTAMLRLPAIEITRP